MILDSNQVQQLYNRLAPRYDVAVEPFRWLGLAQHRQRAVDWLQLQPGDRVVDLGCGTGLNFPYLYDAVGPQGQIIGIDLSARMLAQAKARCRQHGFHNVLLIQADLATYPLPPTAAGAIATFALEMVPAYDAVIRQMAMQLSVGGRLALYGLRHPEGWPRWLIDVAIGLTRPFGVTRAYEEFRPWLAVRRHLQEIRYEEFLLGAAYLSLGEC